MPVGRSPRAAGAFLKQHDLPQEHPLTHDPSDHMSRLRQAIELARLLPQPGALHAMRTWHPFSITAFQMLRRLHALGLRPRTVLDGGANIGQFARAAAETFPTARVVSFEPLPDIAARLREHLADLERVRIIESALGPEAGTTRFFRTDYSLASSALQPTHAEAHQTEVPVGRLDDLLVGEPLESPVLLKLDLQGYELAALSGAEDTLRQAHHVLLEVAFEEEYVGEPRFDELNAFLGARGFRFLRPVDTLTDEHGLIVQMDALFERAD